MEHRFPKIEQRSSEQLYSPGRSTRKISDTICKDPNSVSIKEKIEEKISRKNFLNPVDSLRPIDLSKMNFEESLRILIKVEEFPGVFHGREIEQAMEDSLSYGFSPRVKTLVREFEKKASQRASEATNPKQKKAVEYAEGRIKQIIESYHNAVEKNMRKPEFNKKNEDLKLRWARSLSPTRKPEDLKAASLARNHEGKPVSNSSFQFVKLEGASGLREIRTNNLSNNRNMEFLSGDGGETHAGKAAKSFYSTTKEASGSIGDTPTSPRLQNKKLEQERKCHLMIPSNSLTEIQMQKGNKQPSESVPPNSKFMQKSSNSLDRNGNAHLLHNTNGYTAINAPTASNQKQHQIIQREILSVKELGKVAPQVSSPNSVVDTSLYQDDLPLFPLSVSNTSKDHILEQMHLPQNHISSFKSSFRKPKGKDKSTTEPPVFNEIPLMHYMNDPNSRYVAEALLSSSLLAKGSPRQTRPKQLKPIKLFKAAELNYTQILYRQLVYDVVNEILCRKIESFNSSYYHDNLFVPHCSSPQRIFKELCLEVKNLQRSSENGSLNDKKSIFTEDLLRQSNAWNCCQRKEVSFIVLEIERFISADLIKEVVNNVIAVVTKLNKRYERMLLF